MNTILRSFLLTSLLSLSAACVHAQAVAYPVTARVRPINSNPAPITALRATVSATGRSIENYQIVSIPTVGTLRTGNTIISAGNNLTPTQMQALTYEPGSTGGNITFTYNARESGNGNANNRTSSTVTYTIPVSIIEYPYNGGFAAGFDFAQQQENEVWTARTATAEGGITITTSNYTAAASNPATVFSVTDATPTNLVALPSNALAWYTDYSGMANTSTVTFTFSSPVRGLALVLMDIDANTTSPNNFIDEVRFDGYEVNASGVEATTPIVLTNTNFLPGTRNQKSNVTANALVGTADSPNETSNNAIVSFPVNRSIKRLVITYRNTAPSSTDLSQQIIGVSSMAWASSANAGAPLPVTLTTFTAQAAGQDAKITWTTAQEVNSAYFVVERSYNGSTFAAVKEVAAKGSKTTTTDYTVTDTKAASGAANGVVYYRLRQVDVDGTVAFSSVQTVNFSVAKAAVAVHPNPATTAQDARLDLTGVAGSYQVTITDLTGRVVCTISQQGGTDESLPTATLPKGVYIVQIQGNGQSYVQRLVQE